MSKIEYLSDEQKLRLRIVEIMGDALMEGSDMESIPRLNSPPIKLPNQKILILSKIEKYILGGYTE